MVLRHMIDWLRRNEFVFEEIDEAKRGLDPSIVQKCLGESTLAPEDHLFRKRKHWLDILLSFISSFCGMLVVAGISSVSTDRSVDAPLLISSFGATAVLLYAAPQSRLAQPRNLIVGHTISALVGVSMAKAFEHTSENVQWLSWPLSTSLAILAMEVTNSLHPPGGATALLATIGTDQIKDLGFMYVLFPVLVGALIMLVVALVTNNFVLHRSYPKFWW
jgi:CBS domain-containing membrane protein